MRSLTIAVLVVVLGTSGAAGAASVRLDWSDNSLNETGFDIERKTEACSGTAGTFAKIGGVGQNVTTFSDTFVAEGQTYCYRADAFNTAGKSAYSNLAETTVPFTVPAAPSGLKTTVVP